MKKMLLILGILSMIAGVLSFLFAAFNLFSYHHVMDGTAELFLRLQQRMNVSFVVGEEPMIILAKGRSNLVELRRLTMRIRDDVIRHTAEQICEKVDNILRVLKEQPEDIPTVRQFFNYYLPTLGNVLLKFIHLESNVILDQDIFSKTLACLTDINAAMDKQYENLFADDVLDLTVEMQVLSTMCRQDGLLDSEDFVLHDGSRDIQLTL